MIAQVVADAARDYLAAIGFLAPVVTAQIDGVKAGDRWSIDALGFEVSSRLPVDLDARSAIDFARTIAVGFARRAAASHASRCLMSAEDCAAPACSTHGRAKS